MKAIFNKRGFRLAMLGAGLAVVVPIPILFREIRPQRDQQMTSSCANHAIQLRSIVMTFVGNGDRFHLEPDARLAISQPGQWPAGWLDSFGSACPESFLRDTSIGYVFVADGMPTKVLVEQSALVFFCPADSHQRSEQHCHALVGGRELLWIKSNAEMIELLRQEVERARRGIVPYSSAAISTMGREMQATQNYARERKPNEGTGAGEPRQLPSWTH